MYHIQNIASDITMFYTIKLLCETTVRRAEGGGHTTKGRSSAVNKYGCNGKGKGKGNVKDEYSDSGEVKQTRTK